MPRMKEDKRTPADFPIRNRASQPTPVDTRGEGKHSSVVLRKALRAFDTGEHATLGESVDAFYEEYSGRKVSNEVELVDVDRRIKTKQRMHTKLRSMVPK